MSYPMRIGYLQFAPKLGGIDANISNLERLMAGMEQADLLVLPELCSTGYNFASRDQAWELSEEISKSRYVQFLKQTCSQRKCFIVSGLNEREGDKLYNTAVLIGPEGYIGKYRKIHLFMNEKDVFTPGEAEPEVFYIGSCRLGMLICFDWIFPEVWRILALKGADVIAHPSNLVIPGLAQRAVPVHALINRVYVVLANRIGTEREITFTGQSQVADPTGEVLVQASSSGEEVDIVEIDPLRARDKRVTPRNDALGDRRPDLYRSLIELQNKDASR